MQVSRPALIPYQSVSAAISCVLVSLYDLVEDHELF